MKIHKIKNVISSGTPIGVTVVSPASAAIPAVIAPPVAKKDDWDDCSLQVVLTSAIDILENQGWIRGMLFSHNGSVCAMGAITKAVEKQLPARRYNEREALKIAAYDALRKQIRAWSEKNNKDLPVNSVGQVNIATWNDSIVTDKRTVIRVFKKAVAALNCSK